MKLGLHMEGDKKGGEIRRPNSDAMTRRQAIKKLGYASLSAATMMILLNTQSAKAASDAPEAPTAPASPSGGGSPIWN